MNAALKVPPSPANNCTIIIGAGIVGSALAYFLSQDPQSPVDRQIILLGKSFAPLQDSTAHAPGFVGRYNESAVLNSLAVDSVEEYLRITGGFDQVGGLVVAGSDEGVSRLRARYENAKKAGLEARLLGRDEIRQMAGDLVRLEDVNLGLLFPGDGVAEAGYRQRSTGGQDRGHGHGNMGEEFAEELGDNTNFSSGPSLYVWRRAAEEDKTPWVRWLEHHFYARDHDNRVGCGSYDHIPVLAELGDTAIGNRLGAFEVALEKGRRLFPASEEAVAKERFNSIFAMTPDSPPLAGRMHTLDGGLFIAAAVW